MPASPAVRRRPKTIARQEGNTLLAALPRAARLALEPHLEEVQLAEGQVLSAPGAAPRWIYFPETTVVSVIASMRDGACAEVGTMGWEGMTGLVVLFDVDASPFKCFVQVPGRAQRIKAVALRQLLHEHAPLRALLLRYAHTALSQVSQTAACNALHHLNARCARWLLMTDDWARPDGPPADAGPGFDLKQSSLAFMLGVRREAVSAVASAHRDAGLIRFARGHITVVDRAGLERAACECYAATRLEYSRVMG